MKQAHYVKDLDGFKGEAKLFRMDPPLEGHKFVVASAVIALFSGPETYLFPADADGKVTDWIELEGSASGTQDHEEAIRNAGYKIAKSEKAK